MAALANALHADAWFTMPHLADDDYVRNFAQTAPRLLDPGLKAYVEYSNEVWNRGFAQAHYAQQRGLGLHLSSDQALRGDLRNLGKGVSERPVGRRPWFTGGES